MSKKNKTKQGVRDLNHNFGPPPKRARELPDDCTLGLHTWGEWQYTGYYNTRECEECEEVEYHNPHEKFQNNAFEEKLRIAA